jgi:hypothetical protein
MGGPGSSTTLVVTTTRFVGNDSGNLIVTGRACCVWGLRLTLSGCMSFLVCGSFVSDLHSVPFVETFRRAALDGAHLDVELWRRNSTIVLALGKNSGFNALASRWLPALSPWVSKTIHGLFAVLTGVRHDIAEPEGQHEDCDDP